MRILVVEDEKRLAASLRTGLEAEGFAVDTAYDGQEGLWYAREHDYDAILLDIMLPVMNGYKVCETLRAEQNWTPILMLTAKAGEWDQIEALDTGADDYVTKPFSPKELMARIKAVLRRRAPQLTEDVVAINGLKLDPATHRVAAHAEGSEIKLDLGPTEFRLLHFFMTHPERVHSRTQLLDQVWGDHVFVEERTVDVHIKRLRAALKPAGCDAMIETVRGSGYRLAKSA